MTEAQNGGVKNLLTQKVSVVNIGLEGFAKDLKTANVTVVNVDWMPPAGGDPKMAALLAKLGV